MCKLRLRGKRRWIWLHVNIDERINWSQKNAAEWRTMHCALGYTSLSTIHHLRVIRSSGISVLFTLSNRTTEWLIRELQLCFCCSAAIKLEVTSGNNKKSWRIQRAIITKSLSKQLFWFYFEEVKLFSKISEAIFITNVSVDCYATLVSHDGHCDIPFLSSNFHLGRTFFVSCIARIIYGLVGFSFIWISNGRTLFHTVHWC